MNAPITTTPAGDLLANIHELEWLDVGAAPSSKSSGSAKKPASGHCMCTWSGGSISGASP
ncbi:MAG: hypothetical protein CM15mP103_12630 [Gammaproteobacteria bacterium]|nr:MAG: hypothetical protein CM15mP103_12630 [Gammaproteobacteria bacterium]